MSSGDEHDARTVGSDDFPAVQRECSAFFTIHTSKDLFSQCGQLQGIHTQVKRECVGTLTTIEIVTIKQSDKHNNMFNVAANLKHVNTHDNNN